MSKTIWRVYILLRSLVANVSGQNVKTDVNVGTPLVIVRQRNWKYKAVRFFDIQIWINHLFYISYSNGHRWEELNVSWRRCQVYGNERDIYLPSNGEVDVRLSILKELASEIHKCKFNLAIKTQIYSSLSYVLSTRPAQFTANDLSTDKCEKVIIARLEQRK